VKLATMSLDTTNYPESEPTPQPTREESTLSKIDVDVHNQCWAFGVREATKVYPEKFKGGNLSGGEELRVDLNLTSRMILAQVFYKKNMDYLIHKK